jgi:hypothetical protein
MTTKAYPQCEKCYLEENTQWEPESVGDDGSLISKLTAVTVPDQLKTGEINVCASCGEITIVGIYANMEPDEVQYDVDPLNLDDLDTDPYSKGT